MVAEHKTPNSSSQSDSMKMTGVGDPSEQTMGRARVCVVGNGGG